MPFCIKLAPFLMEYPRSVAQLRNRDQKDVAGSNRSTLIATRHYPRSQRLNQSAAGTVIAKASVENKSIDAISACEDLYFAAKSTLTVARGKLQHTSDSRANGL
jgi:hypothetical protein